MLIVLKYMTIVCHVSYYYNELIEYAIVTADFYLDTRLDDNLCFLFISRSHSEFISRCYASSQRTLFSNLKLTTHSLSDTALYAYFMYSNTTQ